MCDRRRPRGDHPGGRRARDRRRRAGQAETVHAGQWTAPTSWRSSDVDRDGQARDRSRQHRGRSARRRRSGCASTAGRSGAPGVAARRAPRWSSPSQPRRPPRHAAAGEAPWSSWRPARGGSPSAACSGARTFTRHSRARPPASFPGRSASRGRGDASGDARRRGRRRDAAVAAPTRAEAGRGRDRHRRHRAAGRACATRFRVAVRLLGDLLQAVRQQGLLQLENLQMTGSFKERSALTRPARSARGAAAGVIAASAGNHAQGVSYHATRQGLKALVVMPITTPLVKYSATRGYGADVLLHGRQLRRGLRGGAPPLHRGRAHLIHPFDATRDRGAGDDRPRAHRAEPVPRGGGRADRRRRPDRRDRLRHEGRRTEDPRDRVQTARLPVMKGRGRRRAAGDGAGGHHDRRRHRGPAARRRSHAAAGAARYVDDIVTVDRRRCQGILLLLEAREDRRRGAGAAAVARARARAHGPARQEDRRR